MPCAVPCRAVHADQRAFVITLTRAGEDDKSFRLTDIDSTFASFAGADYDLQVGGAEGEVSQLPMAALQTRRMAALLHTSLRHHVPA